MTQRAHGSLLKQKGDIHSPLGIEEIKACQVIFATVFHFNLLCFQLKIHLWQTCSFLPTIVNIFCKTTV